MCCLGIYKKTTSDRKVTAWRTWRVSIKCVNGCYGRYTWKIDGKYLVSPINGGNPWRSKYRTSDHPPARDNYNGFWTFRTMKAAARYHAGFILGEVECSGTVVEHRSGYRAQKVKILSLNDRALAKRYGVAYVSDPAVTQKLLKQFNISPR